MSETFRCYRCNRDVVLDWSKAVPKNVAGKLMVSVRCPGGCGQFYERRASYQQETKYRQTSR